jgi:hypothetical protein
MTMNKNEAIRLYAKARAILSLPLVFVWLTTAALAAQIYIRHSGDTQWNPGDPGVFTITDTNDWDAFDAYMRDHATAGTTVNIGKGVFLTRGVWDGSWGQSSPPGQSNYGFRVQTGCTIAGQGKCGATNGTTLRLVEVKTSDNSNTVIRGGGEGSLTNVTVQDLEIDCNGGAFTNGFSTNELWYIQGISLCGTGNMKIHRVRVINASSNQVKEGDTENFVIEITSTTGLSRGNEISECTVTNMNNGDCSAITLNRGAERVGALDGIVSNCDVGLNPKNRINGSLGGREQQYAYNAHRTRDAVFSGNKSFGAVRAFNNDVHFNENLTIIGNHFYIPEACMGLKLINGMRYSQVLSNEFVVQGNGATAVHVSGPCAYPHDLLGLFGANDITFQGNEIKVDQACSVTAGNGFFFGDADELCETTPHRIELTNNVVNSPLTNFVPIHSISNAYAVVFVGHMEGNTGIGIPTITDLTAWRWTGDVPPFDFTLQPGDANGDGFTDIVFQDTNTAMKVWYMCPDPTNSLAAPNRELYVTNHLGLPVGPGADLRVVGTGDVNNDEVSDLLFQDSTGLTGWWTLTGPWGNEFLAGAWIMDTNDNLCNSGEAWKAVGCGDFVGDGTPDLLFQHDDKTLVLWELSWYTNCVRYVKWWEVSPQPPSADWRVAGMGDFNRDGKPDILLQHRGSGSLKSAMVIWMMDGLTRLYSVLVNPMQPYDDPDNPEPTDLDWRVLGMGDSDGDRFVDLLFQKKTLMTDQGGDVMIWPMFGSDRVARRPLAGFDDPDGPDKHAWEPVTIPPGVFSLRGPK